MFHISVPILVVYKNASTCSEDKFIFGFSSFKGILDDKKTGCKGVELYPSTTKSWVLISLQLSWVFQQTQLAMFAGVGFLVLVAAPTGWSGHEIGWNIVNHVLNIRGVCNAVVCGAEGNGYSNGGKIYKKLIK